MTTRDASCSCGQFHLACEGEPVRISVCHCLACQQRTGSAFGVQARFRREQVTRIEGRSTAFARVGDSGNAATFQFCAACGSTVYWEIDGFVAVAVGAFADPTFPEPRVSVYEARRHAWAQLATRREVEHHD